MLPEYYIVGGYIKIQRNIFVREMLGKDSRLRALLNWGTTKDFAKKHPLVDEAGQDDTITINFSSDANVNIGESPKEILEELKAKYSKNIKGKVSCRGSYWNTVSFFEVDLNSDDDKIEYVLK
ncbi:MAG: hypothetical protein N3B21_13405 [Clostridia bacterium]|nr:hypothetical protein [Clostridia bacterium]